MAKGKLKSFTPIMKNNQHSSWSKNGKIYYNFTVEFDNGDKGQASSISITPKWEIGKEFNYEISTNDKGYTNIRGMKAADFVPGGGGGAYRNSPEDNKSIAFAVALDCAVNYAGFKIKQHKINPVLNISANLSDVLKIAKFMYILLVPHVKTKQTFISSCTALKQAVAFTMNQIPMTNSPVTKLEELQEVFNTFFENLKSNGNISLG